jgi:hypothetical protein
VNWNILVTKIKDKSDSDSSGELIWNEFISKNVNLNKGIDINYILVNKFLLDLKYKILP